MILDKDGTYHALKFKLIFTSIPNQVEEEQEEHRLGNWKITGEGGRAEISEGYVTASGRAYWIEGLGAYDHLQKKLGKVKGSDDIGVAFGRGLFDFENCTFQGSWQRNGGPRLIFNEFEIRWSRKKANSTMMATAAASYITASLVKLTKRTGNAIAFRQDSNDSVVVGAIPKESEWYRTPMRKGAHVLSINNTTYQSATEYSNLIQMLEGPVTILARTTTKSDNETYHTLVTGTVQKPTKDASTGIVFRQTAVGAVYIFHIEDGSLFSKTDLVPGMQLVKVNNRLVHSPTEAAAIVRESSGLVTVLAEHLTTQQAPMVADAVLLAPYEPSAFLSTELEGS